MSILARIGANIAGRTVINVARRIAREAKIKRKAYREGYADAQAGKPAKR